VCLDLDVPKVTSDGMGHGRQQQQGSSGHGEPAAADRRGIGFGWVQNAWLLHARLKIHRGGLAPVCG
jgi:hypothetical protein